MIKVSDVQLELSENESVLLKKCAKKAQISESKIKYLKITKKSLDARNRGRIVWVYSAELYEQMPTLENKVYERVVSREPVAVVGAGPCGLFCALTLARHGVNAVLFERGEKVSDRKNTVGKFLSGGELNVQSNVQFGEGGAGAFSDGKLNTGNNNRLIADVLEDFALFGAPGEIVYLNKPHIGSDKLSAVIENMRNEFIRLGGKIFFNSLCRVIIENGKVVGLKVNGETHNFKKVCLAIGHSARDTFYELYSSGVAMEQKEFAVGFRCEQLQSVIDKSQYRNFYRKYELPAADYKLVSHKSERSVFTFCMCPGGYVIPSTSERGQVVTNGMSNYARDGKNANSAIICQILKSDFSGSSPLAGIEFQRMLERRAFLLGGEDYGAPCQIAKDYINGEVSKRLFGVLPTYSRGYRFENLEKLFPSPVNDALKKALVDMNGKIDNFIENGAILTGVESRTSSPVRILRKADFTSVNTEGLYLAGEGCGYAGGITSAGVDGIRVANAIIASLNG
ncbi:MAG: NAD(P)/FAD-dependent oxidoreductase [Christensenellaceae bacterium]